MKKEYILEGLTCANCAGKIENDVKKISGIENCLLYT
ncbi:cation transporter, partial [Enterococcus sp. S181_ASV_20]|nr:cation transporter [Enterococcus sp. S181_ASV_20]